MAGLRVVILRDLWTHESGRALAAIELVSHAHIGVVGAWGAGQGRRPRLSLITPRAEVPRRTLLTLGRIFG
jgi:hypothetical protein